MSEIFLGRQPILDASERVVAYELLYRGEARGSDLPPEAAPLTDPDSMTARVAVNSFFEIGMDTVVGNQPAFLNLPRGFWTRGDYRSLPPRRVVLEVLEDIVPDREFATAVERARARGYRIALDDYVPGSPQRALIDLAHYVKVDIAGLGRDALDALARDLARPGLVLLAEKVETREQFELCRDLGFTLFQGWFFCAPRLIQNRGLPARRAALLQLMARIQDPATDFDDVAALIEQDLSLSLRLLRYVNSVLHGLPNRIDSIRHATVLLGLDRIRGCILLLLMSGVDDKPGALVVNSLVRARMCQLLAPPGPDSAPRCFTIGLLSTLDAFLDQPLEPLLDGMPLSDEVRAAILHRSGPAGEVLELAIACERADWERLRASSMSLGRVQTAYVSALSWATTIAAALEGEGQEGRLAVAG